MTKTCQDEPGFTVIEVLVAATILLIGVLGTVTMVNIANGTTSHTKTREGATNLAREVVEDARTIQFGSLSNSTATGQLQAMPGLANATPGGAWTVVRRRTSYSITVSVCSLDDPKDGYGSHAGVTFCPDSATTGTADGAPEDFKRVTVDVSWTSGSAAQSVRQVALRSANGTSDAPVVKTLALTNPVVAQPSAPVITSSATTSLTFTATTTSAASVVYAIDGADQGSAAQQGTGGTDWTFSLPIASYSDGTYEVSVRALDARGREGPVFTIPLTLLRSQPSAPTGLLGGPNSVYRSGALVAVTELNWNANPERNVIGYRVYGPTGALICPGSAQTLDLSTSCIDFSSSAGGTYSVAALYRAVNGAIQEGPRATTTASAGSSQRNYYFKNSTGFTATNCGAAYAQRDLAESFAGLDPETTFSRTSGYGTFTTCSATFSAGESMPAGTATLTGYLNNTSGAACAITAQLSRNGTTALGSSVAVTVPSYTTLRAFTWSLPVSATTFAAGDRLNLLMSWNTVAACNSTYLHYSGTTYRSGVSTPGSASTAPNPPTNLAVASLADGTTQLSWSAPAGGSPVSFYRIYRDGREYTSRYDTTGSGTEVTYIDTSPGGASHSYYITAVGQYLSESTFLGPVTG